jgi:hypothetical protein
VDQSAQLIASVFQDDPLFNWILHNNPNEKKSDLLSQLIHGMLRAAALSGASIYEVGVWGASAVILPPGHKPNGLLTALKAGLVPAVVSLGVPACKVCG